MKNILIITFCLLIPILNNSFVTSDEAVNLQMVKNMEYDTKKITRPSYDPGGHRDWENKSLEIIQMTPFFHWVKLAFYKILPTDLVRSSRILNTIIFFLLFIVLRKNIQIEHREYFTLFFPLAIIPIHYQLLIEHESYMTLFGFSSMYFSSLGLKEKKHKYFLVSGFLLGLSFLSKLWLCGAFGLGLLLMLIASTIKEKLGIKFYLISSFATLFTFLLASSIHLIVTYLTNPNDLNIWLTRVYFGVFGIAGDHKDKLNTITYYTQPFYYYFFVIIRDLFNLFPFILYIISDGKKIFRNIIKDNFTVGCLGTILSVLIFSKINSKDPMYILPAMISISFIIVKSTIENQFINTNKNFIIIFSIITFGVWTQVNNFGVTVKSLNREYYLLVGIYLIISCALLFVYHNKKKYILLATIPLFISPFIFSHIERRTEYNELIEYINKSAPKRDPRNTMVIADGYSFIGYHIWNRVLKYDWATKGSAIADVLVNKQYLYFVVNEKTENREEILGKAKELGLQQKNFEKNILIYR